MAKFCLVIEDDDIEGSEWRCRIDPMPKADASADDLTDAQCYGIAIMNFCKKKLISDVDLDEVAYSDLSDEAEDFLS